METPSLYQSVVFFLPEIVAADVSLTEVYARIKSVVYDFKEQAGTLNIEVAETLNPQISYNHQISFTTSSSEQLGAQALVGIVLANIPGSSIYTPE